MNYIIKEMKENNIDGIVNIENKCFSSPWTREGIEEELINPLSHFLVAVADEIEAGYIGVQEICGEAYVTNVGVLPEYRRNGIARALVSAAINAAEERECEFITLEVRESNAAAIALYEALGFENAGRRKGFYTKPNEDALLFTKTFRKESI